MKRAFLFYGLPGTGKGTQSRMLIENLKAKGLDCFAFDMGSNIRKLIEDNKDSMVVKRVEEVVSAGGLVPSGVPTSIVFKKFVEEYTGQENIVIDGGGRKYIEAVALGELLKFVEVDEMHVFFLSAPDEEIEERLVKRGRTDDDIDTIRARIKAFYDPKDGTITGLNYFKELEGVLVHEIDGVGTPEEIQERILKFI